MQATCQRCGWPHGTHECPACGTPRAQRATGVDFVNVYALRGPQPEDFPQLRAAFAAWRTKDYNRLVGQCLVALGIDGPRITKRPMGPAWSFVRDSAAVFVLMDNERGELAIESPVLHLPETQRVPLMRTLLDLNAQALGAARFCLRDSLIVLRFADRMENLAPPKVIAAIGEVALRADQFDDTLSLTFGAKMAGPEIQRKGMRLESLGEPLRLSNLRGVDLAPLPPPSPSTEGPLQRIGPAAGLAVMLDHAEALCEFLRDGQRISTVLSFLNPRPEMIALYQRAFAMRMARDFRSRCPDAVSVILRATNPLFERANLTRDAKSAIALAVFDQLITRILSAGGQVGKQKPHKVSPLTDPKAARALLRLTLVELEGIPDDAAIQFFVLAGVLAEVLERAPLPDKIKAKIEDIYTTQTAETPTRDSVDRLIGQFRRLSSG